MILPFWSWCDISVSCDATCLKIVPHNNIFFVYTLPKHVLCNLKEQPDIYPKTAMPSMHWLIKETVHVRDATILTFAVSAFRFYGCSIIIHKQICPEDMANFLYDMGFLGPWIYRYATVSYNQILDHLKFWPVLTMLFGKKYNFLQYIPLKIEIICNQNCIGLKYFTDILFGIF